jgi:hypothetical protein
MDGCKGGHTGGLTKHLSPSCDKTHDEKRVQYLHFCEKRLNFLSREEMSANLNGKGGPELNA